MHAPEVATLVDCSYRQLQRWCALGIFGDDDRWSPGSGRRVEFSVTEIEWAWVCARLVEMGAELSVLKPVIDYLTVTQWASGSVLLVFDDGSAMLVRRTNVFPAEPCWCIPLRTLAEIHQDHETI